MNAQFEDVSDAVLELETEEDATAGFDDLPDVVKVAAAASASDDDVTPVAPSVENISEEVVNFVAEDVPEEVAAVAAEELVVAAEQETDTEFAIAENGAEEVDTIAALAQAMEEETSAEDAPPPAPSDIRSLLLRVEALAKKAEAMRLAQGVDLEISGGGENTVDEQKAEATVEKDGKNAGVAA